MLGVWFQAGLEVGGTAGAPSSAPFLLHLERSKRFVVYYQPRFDGQDGDKDTGTSAAAVWTEDCTCTSALSVLCLLGRAKVQVSLLPSRKDIP